MIKNKIQRLKHTESEKSTGDKSSDTGTGLVMDSKTFMTFAFLWEGSSFEFSSNSHFDEDFPLDFSVSCLLIQWVRHCE